MATPLMMYTIYRRDGEFLAVEFAVDGAGARQVAAAKTLDDVRDRLHEVAPAADAMIVRSPEDNPDVIETWL